MITNRRKTELQPLSDIAFCRTIDNRQRPIQYFVNKSIALRGTMSILKGYDDGTLYFGLLGFWTSSIV